ncbi:tetratricopeptide repeat protein [Dactylosporangium sp. NBC_01737]|uniref:ATP-binding protein n=1 Tax=Dactylosporangium sp. NBC_01737 TaxID=2975959 RepID=UPI002E14FEB8|nr:tetratricopeptide repeat protein [Dactylosporangium sp. NBC_01737]
MCTTEDLARMLRELRRRDARRRGGVELTYRELAAATGWSHGIIGGYLAGRVLPPTDRFDVLVRLLGASPAEQGALATARDRVQEGRRATATPPPPPDAAVPRQLPADVPAFTGRAARLAELDALLGDGPRVALLAGTAGVGKTALAVHWAHRVAARFPDGQLYVDLCGYDPGQPVDPGDALAGFLRGLGVPASGIPAATAERAARYRTEVAGRRLLVVLDNASGADQVRPLLPGTGTCVVVVTSRDALGGLVARDGVHPIHLGRLDRGDSRTLLRRLIGPDAAGTVQLLAERCAGLPLALRVAATRHRHPHDDGLDAFDADGDPRTALRSVFSWSLRQLTPPAAAAFRLLGLHPGRVVDVHATAALAGLPPSEGRSALHELARAHLVEPAGDDCFAMHDLLRAYSVELAGQLDADGSRAALDRLTAHLLHTAAAATATLYPHDHPGRTASSSIVDTPERAQRWLDRHRAALIALARSRAAVELSRLLWRHLEVGGHYRDALALHTAAAVHGDAGVHTNLGAIHWLLGDHDRAKVHFGRSLHGHRASGDTAGEARATARLALVHERLGDHDEAAARLRDALAMYRAAGDRHGEAAQLLNLGFTYHRIRRHTEALGHLQRAAALFAELGDRRLEGYALGNLGAVESVSGRHDQALTHLRQALERCVAAGDRGGEGSAHGTIGAAYHRTGRHAKALGHLRRALAIARATGECGLEAETLTTLGDVLLATGRPDAAARRFAAARALAERTGDRHTLATAVDGLSRCTIHLRREAGMAAR